MRNLAFAFIVLAFSTPTLADPKSPPPPKPGPCAQSPNEGVCVIQGESNKAFGQAVAQNARNGIQPPVSP